MVCRMYIITYSLIHYIYIYILFTLCTKKEVYFYVLHLTMFHRDCPPKAHDDVVLMITNDMGARLENTPDQFKKRRVTELFGILCKVKPGT